MNTVKKLIIIRKQKIYFITYRVRKIINVDEGGEAEYHALKV